MDTNYKLKDHKMTVDKPKVGPRELWSIGDKAEVKITGFNHWGYPIIEGGAVVCGAYLSRPEPTPVIQAEAAAAAERQALEAWVTYQTFLDTWGTSNSKRREALDVAANLTRIVVDMRKPPNLEQMLDTLRQTVIKARMPVAAVSEILDQITAIEKAYVNENQV
jgi:hypothetical protein